MNTLYRLLSGHNHLPAALLVAAIVILLFYAMDFVRYMKKKAKK